MKVNTDGVLLGALAEADRPERVLDIGTGTGVIALMLAQRFADAHIDAVEIDEIAAETARHNFMESQFAKRLALFPSGFEQFFETYPDKEYDLIVSNPPFFLNSLASPGAKRNLARHTDRDFFERLIVSISDHLTAKGIAVLILPVETSALVKALLPAFGLHLHTLVRVKSFADSDPHREVITIGKQHAKITEHALVIYSEPKVYSAPYQYLLKAFLTIF